MRKLPETFIVDTVVLYPEYISVLQKLGYVWPGKSTQVKQSVCERIVVNKGIMVPIGYWHLLKGIFGIVVPMPYVTLKELQAHWKHLTDNTVVLREKKWEPFTEPALETLPIRGKVTAYDNYIGIFYRGAPSLIPRDSILSFSVDAGVLTIVYDQSKNPTYLVIRYDIKKDLLHYTKAPQ